MNTYLKFGVLIAVIVGSLVWLAVGGVKDTKAYYKTIPELAQMGAVEKHQRLRVGGDVQPGSIVRNGAVTSFVLHQRWVEGNYAFILWDAETADNHYEAATDTFVVQDGKIVAQSFGAKITAKR